MRFFLPLLQDTTQCKTNGTFGNQVLCGSTIQPALYICINLTLKDVLRLAQQL